MLTIYAAFLGAVLILLSVLYALGTRRQRKALTRSVVLIAFPCVYWLWTAFPAVERTFIGLPPHTGQREEEHATIEVSLPEVNVANGFVSSEACRECHRDQFASWHDTFHRTMTQAATPDAVAPSFDDVELKSRGRTYHLTRKGDEFWVNTISPVAEMAAFAQSGGAIAPSSLPRVNRRIAMTTGSHYHQTYWMQNPNGTLLQFPWVYHIKTERWVYRIDSFLRPPTDTVTFNIWNMSCIACHSTGGEPRVDSIAKTMHSVGEMGISCEACHGPGAVRVASPQVAR